MTLEELKAVFGLFPVAAAIIDPENLMIHLANDKYSRLPARKNYVAAGEHVTDDYSQAEDFSFIEATHQQDILTSLKEVQVSKLKNILECRAFSPSEAENPSTSSFLKITHQPILDDQGEIIYILQTVEKSDKKLNKEEDFKVLMENFPGIAYRCLPDEQWTMKYLSSEVETITGYPVSDFIDNEKRSFASIIHPDDLRLTYSAIEKVKKKKPFFAEYRITGANEETIWVQERGSGVFSSSGELKFIDGVLIDITERLNQQREICNYNRRFEALVQEASDIIAILNENAEIIFASASAEKLLGFTQEEYLEKSVFDFIHPDDVQTVQEKFAELHHHKQVKTPPFRFRNKDGEFRWLQSMATDLQDDPAVKGIVVNSKDITKEFLHKKELQKANERYRLANKATNDALWDYNISKKEIQWGEGYRKIFGYYSTRTSLDLQNPKAYKPIYPEDVEAVITSLQKALENPEKGDWKANYRYYRADGSLAAVVNRATILRNKKGKAKRIVGALQDISEEKNREERKSLISGIQKDIHNSASFKKGLGRMLERLTHYFEVDLAELWLTSIDDKHLNLVCQKTTTSVGEKFVKNNKEVKVLLKGQGLPGTIWSEKTLHSWNKNDLDFLLRNNKEFTRAYGIPLKSEEEIIGVFSFFSQRSQEHTQKFREILEAINEEIGLAILHRKKEEELNSFFNLSNDLLCIVGLDGYFKRVNPAFTRSLGYSEEEIYSIPYRDIIHPEHIEAAKNEVVKLEDGNTTSSFEARYYHKNGSIVWISWTSSPVPGEGLIYAIGKNITPSKRSALQLLESTQRLKYAQEIAKLGYWSREIKCTEFQWSSEVYKILDRKPGEFVPNLENVKTIFHPDDRHFLEKTIHKNHFQDFEHRIITSQGEVKWVLQRVKLITDDKNKPLRLEGIVQDINDKKEKEHQIQVSNGRFKKAMKATEEMIWDWDLIADKVVRGKSFHKVFGYRTSAATTSQNFWFNNIHSEDRKKVKKSLFKALKSKSKKKWAMHYRFVKANGELAHVSDKAFIVRNKEKEAVRIVGAARDITRSKEMIQEIQLQNSLLKDITWIQSHKVRAPLSRILSLVELLPEAKNSKDHKEILDYLERSAKELDEVVKNVVKKSEYLEIDKIQEEIQPSQLKKPDEKKEIKLRS
ncbi:PAS domain-containing protein [Salegentibacter sp. F188]|uniref:histidine kinase n=1 Tax=Autumnicola patrickiae TaxID=3075591 RepID=A0ABU3DZ34_9FLAO|nr:PAS domain-containing protein [Salegentibacter sp. F188]MDT0688974.1 PAS domain-containing protein [Salegentibacter sp. F188]